MPWTAPPREVATLSRSGHEPVTTADRPVVRTAERQTVGRHGTRGLSAPRTVTPATGLATLPSSRRRRGVSPSTSGKILVAAVAAGAALPAIQTLDTHVADAEAPRTTDAASAALSLAAANQRTPAADGVSGAVVQAVAPVTMPGARGASAGDAEDGASAGDAADVSALLKAMDVTRENGPLEFGRPYAAGNERTLDGQIAKALGMMGLPQRLAPGVKKIIMRESTGNAHAVNDWDSNASAGTPSKGLMQLIDTTFRNAVLPELADRGIFDPVANITAGVRTMIANHSIDDVMSGGLRNSAGHYIGYGGAALPDDGLGLAGRS